MRVIKTIALAVSIAVLAVLSSEALADSSDKQCRIGVLAKRGPEMCLAKWFPTAEYLTGIIQDHSFSIVPLGFDEINPAVEKGEVDFILADPSFYVGLEYLYGANRIATLNNLSMGKGYTIFGGVIFCRADRKDMRHLKDLKGKSFMAVKETSFGGWLAAWREMKEHQIDPFEDFSGLSFGGTHDAVVYAVRDGKVDAGTVRTDALERMAKENKIRLEDFYVFSHDHTHKYACEFPFAHSTNTYPEWPFAKVRHTSDALAKRVTIALLEMSSDDPAARAAKCVGWTIPLNYQPVHDCLKELHVSPYEDYGKITAEDVIKKYWMWLAIAIVTMSIIVITLAYIFRLNRRLHKTLTITQDEITRRMKAEQGKENLQKQLMQSEKMASIGQLAAGVAHEINNPVGYIYSNLNTMNKYLWKITKEINNLTASEKNDNGLNELMIDFGDAIAESLEGADRIRQIVSDLKSFSRADSGDMEYVDIVKCIETSLNVVWNQLKYHCKVEKEYNDLPMVNCYPNKIDQVLVNLLVNAGQATQGKEGLIKITARAEGDDVIVSIRDNGVGIPEENLKAIFDPFFTTKDVGKGTGLGLSVSYGIVQEHGGRIEVDSKAGEGTEFRVILPFRQPALKPEVATAVDQ